MSPKQYPLAGFVVGVLLLQGSSSGADDSRPLGGSVRDGDNRPVVQEQVSIEQGGSYLTSNSGEFEFPPPDSHKTDPSAIRFHVRNWVVVKPCELVNGRAYLGAASFDITVYKRRDKRLLDFTRGAIYLPCLVQEMVSNFRLTKDPPADSRTSAAPDYPNPRRHDDRTIRVAWTTSFQKASEDEDPLGRNEFTLRKSEEEGFSPGELLFALNEWAKSPGDTYHRGLAALYNGKYSEAASLINESIHSSELASVGRFVALARAEYEQGHLEAARSALLKALELHPTDAIVKTDLDVVSRAATEAIPEKKRTDGADLASPQGTGGNPNPPIQTTTYIEKAIIALIGLVALSLLLYYVYKLLVKVLEEDFNRRFRNESFRKESVSKRREASVITPVVAAFILSSVYSAFRSVGGRPPEHIEQMIHKVRGTEERPSAGMGA
jgi:tetratricopeptide (TPR) repeat protein